MRQEYKCKTRFEFEKLKQRTGRTATIPDNGLYELGDLFITFEGEEYKSTITETYQHAFYYVKVFLGR